MARTYYVNCPHCRRDYNVDKTLVDLGLAGVKLRCPYCKRDFIYDFQKKESMTANPDRP